MLHKPAVGLQYTMLIERPQDQNASWWQILGMYVGAEQVLLLPLVVQVPSDHELRQGVPQGAEPGQGHRQDQAGDPRRADRMRLDSAPPCGHGI